MPTTNKELYLIALASERLTVVLDRQAGAIHEAMVSFDQMESAARDTVVDRDDAATKKTLVEDTADMGNRCELATTALRHGALDAGKMAAEIFEALAIRLPELAFHNKGTEDIIKVLRERANNIAAAYAGRVAREPR